MCTFFNYRNPRNPAFSLLRSIQLLRLYRAHQILHRWIDGIFSPRASVLLIFFSACLIYSIVGILILSSFLNPILTLVFVLSLVFVSNAGRFALILLSQTPKSSCIFPDSLKNRICNGPLNKMNKRIIRSCPPLYFHIGFFGPVDDIMFLFIMDKVVTGVIQVLVFYQRNRIIWDGFP